MKKIKNSRGLSFLFVTLIYLFATLVGVWIYLLLPMVDLWLSLLLADIGATVLTFIFSLIFGNASVYDPYWSVQPIVILGLLAIGQNMPLSKILLLVVVGLWAVRLTANWAYTFKGLNFQDWRYTMLNEKCGKAYPLINFLGIHLVPTLVVYACILPASYVITSDSINENAGAYIFLAISLLAVVLQATADIQMHNYRKTKPTPFIRQGVWKYARHPNYLAEILMWWGVGGACTFLIPQNFFLLAGALLNTLLFVFVSIPMAEKRQAKKEGFEEYKKETNYLIPLPKIIKK